MSNKTDLNQFISELDAGIFKEKVAHILSDAALATVLHGGGKKNAKVIIEFTLNKVGENEQVIVSSLIEHKMPTKRGVKGEKDTTETPMFVGVGGQMTINVPMEDSSGQHDIEGLSSVVTNIKK